MKKRDRKALGRYIRAVADEMGLRDWNLHLLNEPADDDCNAQACIIYGRKRASIRVCEGFRDFEPERIRHSVVHELIHCHTAAMDNLVEHDLDEHLGIPTAAIFHAGYRRHAEYAVDGLADALAPHMPLIEWSKRKG